MMLSLSEEQKKMFCSDRYSYCYVLKFPDISLTIDNETLHSESVTVKEAICDEEDFTLGGCIASSIEYEVSEIIANQTSGLEFSVEIAVRDEDGNIVLSVPMGTFRIDSAKQVDDKDYKYVTAYDRMYDASADVSEWYKEYFANNTTHTVKETREALLNYFGIPFVVQNLENDNVMLAKTMDPTKGTLPGTDLLRQMCVVNGGFGRMNRQGLFEVIYTRNAALFPEETLYPSEDLYPEDTFAFLGNSNGDEEMPEYRSVSYEEYTTQAITCLYIQTESELAQIGDDTSNPYIISGNSLLYGKTAIELQNVGQNIFNHIKDIVYRPNTTKLTGLPYMEVGDAYGLVKRTDIIESFILSRSLAGIQALVDTYEAKGNEIRANELSVSERVDQLNAKTDDLQDDLDQTQDDLSTFEETTTSHLEKTDDAIEAEVTRAKGEESSLSSRITVTAGDITAEVTRAKGAEERLSSRINITDNAIAAEVSRAKGEESSLSSRITVTASNISSKVSKGDVCSEINQSSDTITLASNRLIVNSSNFTLNKSGNVYVRGEINATSGIFGDWNVGTGAYGGMYVGSTQNPTNNNPGMWLGLGGIRFVSSSSNYFSVSAAGVYTADLSPVSSGSYNLGSSGSKWNNIYATNGEILTSDRNQKANITDMSEEYAAALIDGAVPKTYRLLSGSSGRTHAGLISQDIEKAIYESGMTDMDFAGFIKYQDEDGMNGYGLRYAEFIAPLIKYCQCLKRDLRQVQEQFFAMKGEMEILKQQGGH